MDRLINIEFLLVEMLQTLKDMKEQERKYWESWRIAKNKEVGK